MTNKNFCAFIALLVLPISGLAIDIYVPSLPSISAHFGVNKALAQLTVTSYLLGMGLMQPFAGGISDSFGRKKPFIISMVIFILATLCIPFSQNIYQLLGFRAIQGVAVGAMIVPMRSVITDLFEGQELQKMFTYMVMAWSLGPIIAPAIGGGLQHYFGWKANFYFLSLYALIGFALALQYLPETSVHRHPFHPALIFRRNLEILCHLDFFSGLLINGLLYSMVILFAVVGPFLIQNVLLYSALEFGQFALLIGLAWFLGALTNRYFIHIDLERKSRICLLSMLAVALLMACCAIFLPMNIYLILLPLFLLTWLGGILFPNYFARGVSLFPKTTGSANALYGAFIFLIAGLSSGLGTYLKSSTQLPLALAYLAMILVCLGIVALRKTFY
jgi:Bcr/CflA subfamily drug resistance transporter